jgi:hypothetical protein
MIDNKPSVCIVGSGPGGAIAAIELARSGKFRVILVDLNKISDANGETNEISELISTCNVGAPFVQNVTRGLGFGGGSQLWHGVLTKLDEEDWGLLDSRLNNNLSSEVKIYYEKIEKYFGKLPYRWADKLKKKITANQGIFGLLEGSGNFIGKDFFIQKNPLRLRKHLQNARDQGLPIQFIENAVAIRINSKMGVDSTVESLLVDVQGEKKIIFADYFILSSGALETPRIMLQSIYEKSLHIKNKNIGKYLTDHPWTILGTIASKKGSFRIGLTLSLRHI